MVGCTEFIDDWSTSYKNLKYFKGSAASSPHSLSVTCASLIRIIKVLDWGYQFFLLRAIIDSTTLAQVLYVILIPNNTSTSSFSQKKKKENQHHQVDQVKAKGLRLPSPRWATQPNQKERPLKSPAH